MLKTLINPKSGSLSGRGVSKSFIDISKFETSNISAYSTRNHLNKISSHLKLNKVMNI
jgi:hypothetical protein